MKLQAAGDKLAIGLSAICIVHCLVLPIFLILFPSLILASVSDELFHQIILFIILPVSVIILSVGYRHHRDKSVFLIGCFGLLILACTAFLSHDLLGELGEVSFTVFGSLIIAFAHFRNARFRHLAASQSKVSK